MSRRILYIQYTNPAGYPPLEHSSHILANEGWNVLFLGTGDFGENKLSFLPHPSITIRQIPFSLPGWRQKLHYLRFCLWLIYWTFRWRPSVVYASDLLSCPIASLLSFFPNLKTIYHEHDSPTQSGVTSFIQLCLKARQLVAKRAAFCILPNQQRAEQFGQELKVEHKTICVWNCPTLEEVSPQKPAIDQDIWVLYHGSIVPDRLPLTVIEALATLPDNVKLRIIGYETVGNQGYTKEIQALASNLRISQRIECLPAMPRHKLIQLCQQSDIGLALMPLVSQDVNLQYMIGASNKPFDYLACGLALLVSDLPDWCKMYVDPGYGLACNPNDTSTIAEALRWYLEHPNKMRIMGEQGRQQTLNNWNYEAQFSVVKTQLDKVLE
jgi:glycosyltransferase involved in cell wall biosynthesis